MRPLSPEILSERISFGIPATCYRTENAQIPKSAGESAGKSAWKKGTAGGSAGSSAGRPVSLEKQRNGTAPSSPPQQSPFSRDSSQHSPRHFWGFGRSQSCSRSLGFQVQFKHCFFLTAKKLVILKAACVLSRIGLERENCLKNGELCLFSKPRLDSDPAVSTPNHYGYDLALGVVTDSSQILPSWPVCL